MHYGIKGLIYLFFISYFFTITSCLDNSINVPTADDFTKQKREELGDFLKETIEIAVDEFPPLNAQSKGDAELINYLQTLYDQATHEIRQDRQSNIADRWNINRKWRVVVLNDQNRYAFSVPGGHFFVSTGFLGALSKGYEIYYVMAFEAINISGRYLIDNLIAQYNTATLFELIASQDTSANPSSLDIVQLLQNDLAFEDDIIREIDKDTGTLICETSIFDRFGIQSILEILNSNEQYRDTRPSYANRVQYISELNIDGCGDIRSTGLYERMVLDNLPR